jgi:cytochrome c553
MKFQLIASSVLSLWLCATSFAQAPSTGSAEEGKGKSTACVACHGVDGNSSNPQWPTLAGQHRQYLAKQLRAFKSGARKDPLMSPMAISLSDDDIEDLSAYFNAQKPTGLEADPAKLALGQRLYRGGDTKLGLTACAACHGAEGLGNPAASYPAIRGQHSTYTAAQLRKYRAGERATDQNQMMRTIASTMSDEQIEALATYIQGLR